MKLSAMLKLLLITTTTALDHYARTVPAVVDRVRAAQVTADACEHVRAVRRARAGGRRGRRRGAGEPADAWLCDRRKQRARGALARARGR